MNVTEQLMITNPVLRGFYPDPSLCRVGNDFYLVNSTFAYFPGIPVFHSTDLVHWEQIGNAVDRPEQIDFTGAGISRGLFAPTIRFHNGTFYLLCTLVDNRGNFIMTAKNPAGPWSDPVFLDGAAGIDPSIFFDDDGTAWYTGTRSVENPQYNGNNEVWLQQLDLARLAAGENPLTGEPAVLWHGALRNAEWPEGPHLYKIRGMYYLLIAEGGTSKYHAVTVARSPHLKGPYEGFPGNPILTHRNRGLFSNIINVGHADLFDDPAGNWWMVLLASRPYGKYSAEPCAGVSRASNLGRETFIVPVVWEDGWPVVSPETGSIALSYPAPPLPPLRTFPRPSCFHFTAGKLPPEWLLLRNPGRYTYSLTERPGYLRLYTSGAPLRSRGNPSFAGIRQRHMSWNISALLEFSPAGSRECAGLVLLQSEDFQYRLEVHAENGLYTAELICAAGAADTCLVSVPTGIAAGAPLVLAVAAEYQRLSFAYGADRTSLTVIAADVDGSLLSTEAAGGFTGTVLGMFASGGCASVSEPTPADFAWFEYSGC